MKAFTYKSAASAEEAVRQLAGNAVALAGGTNLLNLMKERIVQPDVVVNIKSIKGLDRITAAGDELRIGANVTLAGLLGHETVKTRYPALAQALENLATPQIRNMATVGGNLCARPPCWYFTREGFSCPKSGSGRTCAAKEGENEYHAIFATEGPCVAVHASSAAPAFLAYGASVKIAGPGGAREVSLEKFFVLPQENVQRENVLAPNEIVTEVALGKGNAKSATYTVLQRGSHDWPISQASVALEMDGETCRSARIWLGAVAPAPWRAAAAEAALAGKKITGETAGKAADAAVAAAVPLAQNRYKVKVTRAAVHRAILTAAGARWK